MSYRIINRYLMREIAAIFLLGLTVFTLVLLMGRMAKLLEMVVSNGVPLSDVARLIVYLLPSFLVLTIPMALLLAVLLAFGRLSSDNEIAVLKACGVSLTGLLPPVLMTAGIATVLTLIISVYAAPIGTTNFKQLSLKIAKGYAAAAIREHVFRDDIPGVVMYVDAFDEARNRLGRTMIHDARDPERPLTIFAKEGVINSNESTGSLQILLHNGTMHATGKGEGYRFITFNEYLLTISLDKGVGAERTEREFSVGELLRSMSDPSTVAKRRNKMATELHERFAFPFASLVFAVIAIPLGLQNRRSGKGGGFAVSIMVLLVYYVLLSFLRTLAEKGSFPPMLALWLPNMLFFFAGMYLLYRAAQERPLPDLLVLFRRNAG